MLLSRFLLSVNNDHFLYFTGANKEFECVETTESMNILCISIRVTCSEDNSNYQTEFQRNVPLLRWSDDNPLKNTL